jgi:uncharacterized phage protein (TIGR02220 family)
MGQRRMFSLKIINSAKFLKLPVDAQNLYFHLALRADDDGVVEAFSVMRLVGSSEDNLKILHAKELVKVLNEDYVAFIIDWQEHNTIRADRKIDSMYKDLLIEICPEVKLIEPRPRTKWSDICQTNDSVSKDKISKDNIYSPVIDYLNEKAGTKYKATSSKTKSLIDARQNEGYTLSDFQLVIDKKVNEWLGTEWEKFLRPETLFSNKFESYLNQQVKRKEEDIVTYKKKEIYRHQ